jgi:hypothetical protein
VKKVRAKFMCSDVGTTRFFMCSDVGTTRFSRGEQHKVSMYPVTGGTEENDSFWEATPSGKIELDLVDKSALEFFKPGKTFYVDFTEAEEE